MRKAMRHDTVIWMPPAELEAVPMETAAKSLLGSGCLSGEDWSLAKMNPPLTAGRP